MFSPKLYLSALLCIALSLSCKKILISPDSTSDSGRNFEIFWNDLNNGYPYFEEDKIDWQERHDAYVKNVESITTDQLYTYFTSMLKGFSDGHLRVEYNGKFYSNEKEQPNLGELIRVNNSGRILDLTYSNVELINNYTENKNTEPQYGFDNINAGYLISPQTQKGSDGFNPEPIEICTYGLVKSNPKGISNFKNILYVNLKTFSTNYSIEGLLVDLIQDYPSDGMILDLRMNGGGNLGIMWNAMSVFLPQNQDLLKYAYVREKVGPLPQNFGPEQYFGVSARGNTRYTKPVVVLTNRLSVSAAEHATMAMREMNKTRKNIKIIGDYTFGATSFIVQRTLPCGIKYTLVNSKTWDANRIIVEKTGVKPDEQVFLTEGKLRSLKDDQMERAIELLNKGF